MEPVRLSSQFLYHSKRKAISELKEAFFYANIKGVEPVAFDENGYLIEERETKSESKLSINGDIRLSPFPLAKYLMAIYLVDRNGFKIKRNAKISNRLWLVRES